MVNKKITLIGESKKGFEEATQDAVDRADKTLKNIEWVEIDELSVQTPLPEHPNQWTYQAEVEISFNLENPE